MTTAKAAIRCGLLPIDETNFDRVTKQVDGFVPRYAIKVKVYFVD